MPGMQTQRSAREALLAVVLAPLHDAHAPKIDSVEPTSAHLVEPVRITGADFDPGTTGGPGSTSFTTAP